MGVTQNSAVQRTQRSANRRSRRPDDLRLRERMVALAIANLFQ
jgi:hypothetical protein